MTTMTPASTISFKDLFPFHFELDESLVVKSCGPVLLKMEQEIIGKSFEQLFCLAQSTPVSELSFKALKTKENQLLTLEDIRSKNCFKGQLIFQEVTNSLFFIHTPCLITFIKTRDTSFQTEMSLGPIFDSLLPKKSLIDLSKLANLFLYNEEIINKMLQLFADTTPQINLKLKKAIEKENVTEIKNLAHQLRPSLEYIASGELGLMAKEIENMEFIDRFYFEKAFVLYLLLEALIQELGMKLKFP